MQSRGNAAVADVAVEQHQVAAKSADLIEDRLRRRGGCIDARFRARARRVGRERDTRIAGSRHYELLGPGEHRASDGSGQPARLEGARRVGTLVLDPEL